MNEELNAVKPANEEPFDLVEVRDLLEERPCDLKSSSAAALFPVGVDAGRSLARLMGSSVTVEVPRCIAEAIRRGELVRHGGVVRNTAGRVKVHLKDPSKLAKLAKSPAVLFVALDLAQAALLNQKLLEIQADLRSLHGKVDALLESKLRAAFEDVAHIHQFKSREHREGRLHSALDRVSEAIPAAESLLRQQTHETHLAFLKARKERERLLRVGAKRRSLFFEASNKLVLCAEFLSCLLGLKARLQAELGAPEAAEETRNRATAMALCTEDFLRGVFCELRDPPRTGEKATQIPRIPGLRTRSSWLLVELLDEMQQHLHRERVRKYAASVRHQSEITLQRASEVCVGALASSRIASVFEFRRFDCAET